MEVTYDREAEAIYIKFMDRGAGGHCEELISDEVILNKTALGQISGIEILNVERIKDITNKRLDERLKEQIEIVTRRITVEDTVYCCYCGRQVQDIEPCYWQDKTPDGDLILCEGVLCPECREKKEREIEP